MSASSGVEWHDSFGILAEIKACHLCLPMYLVRSKIFARSPEKQEDTL
jgi:hypothetical protein